jgi:membrane protease YdiL (CAAX protease family)
VGDAAFARQLRGFGPIGIFAALVVLLMPSPPFLPLRGIAVLVWARLSGTPLRALGFARPKHWVLTIVGGIVFGVAFKLLMKSLVMPLFGAPAENPEYHDLIGNAAALPSVIAVMVLNAGFGEEAAFRGFLFERLGLLLGPRPFAKVAIVLGTSALFALGHYVNLGLPGVEQAVFTGLAFGTIYALTGRLWLVMTAHAAFDVTAIAIIYWGLEARIAHLFFK